MSVFCLWSCNTCINYFPVNHIVDNDECTCEIIGHNRLNCDKLIFNPFNDEDISNIKMYNFECDPDIHHYDEYSNITDSRYFTFCDLNKTFRNIPYNDLGLSMFHCNIRSANKYANNLRIELQSINHKFDIIALSETWLNSRIKDISGFPDYDHICNYRDTKRGGGGGYRFY